MKRVRMLPFSLAALTALVAPAALRAQAIPVKPAGELSSLVGLPFDVPIVADMTARTERLGSFALRLTWDPAVLRLDAGVDGSFGSTTVNADSLAAGVLRIAGVNPSGAAGVVTLGIGRFTPIAGGTTSLVLTLSELYASGTFADLLPSAVVSGGAYCPARGRFGDVDNDGSANSRDALIALSNAVGLDVSAFDIFLGDVDGSGVTNARDALIILSSAVGLDVSGFRVLRLAGGSCALNPALTMSITPSPLDLVLGQSAQLEARAANGAGGLQSLPDVVWKSSRPSVVAVLGDGRALARDTGTAVITALRGVSDSAQATITVVAGRILHVVDAAAVNATNQLGSIAFPFATIAQALALADSGDTIQIRPGRYSAPVVLERAVVLLGDTLLDGTRPLIFGTGDPYSAGPGVLLLGTGSRLVMNLAFENLYDAVEINGPDAVLLRGLRSVTVENGIVANSPMTSLRLEQSQLIGRGVSIFDSDGIQVNDTMDTLVIEDTEIGDFGGDGVYGYYAQSVTIRRSNLHDFARYGLELGGFGQAVNLVMDSSRLQRSYYDLMYIQDLESAVFSRNILVNENGDILDQYQESIPPGGFISFKGDSIQCEGCYWLYLYALDSLVMDSVTAVIPDSYGYTYNVTSVRVTRSRFLEVSGDALDVYFGVTGGGTGGRVEIRNSQFIGDPACYFCGSGIYAVDATTIVDSVTFVNLYEAVFAYGDSSMTVTNSRFRRVGYGVEWYGNYYIGCTGCNPSAGLRVANNTFDGFYDAIYAFDGIIVVDSNTILAGEYDGMVVGSAQSLQVTRNVIQDVDEGIQVYAYDSSVTSTIADNVLSGIVYEAIYADGDTYPDTIRVRLDIRRNQVTCRAASPYSSGVEAYDADVVVADNTLLGCAGGIYVATYSATERSDSVLRNTIALGPEQDWGIYLFGRLRSRVSQNALTADTTGFSYSAMIYASEYYYYPGGIALIDSNTVTGGTQGGIYLYGLDTVAVGRNTVQDLAGYGISVNGGLSYFAGVSGNAVRRVTGDGIVAGTSDTATVRVDSNLVSAAGRGIAVSYGARSALTRNTVTSSAGNGIEVLGGAVTTSISLNNISGNKGYGLYDYFYGDSAPSNFWGDSLGPRCASGCNPSSTGDSVTTTVVFTPHLTAPNPTSPPTTAPRRLLATGAPALRAAPALVSEAGEMPPARAERPARVRRAAEPPRSLQAPEEGTPAERIQRAQARLERVTSREAARLEAQLTQEAERAAREAAVRERIGRIKSESRSARTGAPGQPGEERRP